MNPSQSPAPAPSPKPVSVQSAPTSTNGLAIAGIVLSFILPLIGLIFSIIGLVKAKNYNGNGKGLAIAGIIISSLFMIPTLFLIITTFATINHRAQESAHQTALNSTKYNAAQVITTNNPLPDHVFGSPANKVVLIEYGDFQCPACGNLYPTITPLSEHYKDQLTFVFREFPLTSLHPNALAAAAAAEAAGLQGKFWEMHHMLYENQNEWSGLDSNVRTDQFVTYATRLGLNIAQFKKDLSSDKIAKKIARDQALGRKIGTSATPTLVLDGQTLDQKSQYNTGAKFEDTVRNAIKASRQTLQSKLN